MAVVFVVAQLEGHRRLEPQAAVRLKAHAHGNPVRHGEGHAAVVGGKEIGVLPELFQGRVPILPPQAHSQHRRQLVPGQEGHQPPEAHVLAEALGDFLGPPGGDALEGGQPLRGGLQDVEGLQAEALHDIPGRGGAHALQHAGGQIAENLLLVLRQAPLHLRRPELLPVLGMPFPHAGDGQALAGGGAGNAAHDGDGLPLLGEEAEDRVAVLGVLKDDTMYGALPADELFHLKRPPLFAFHAGLDFGGEFPGGDQGGVFLPVRQIPGQGLGVGGQAAVRQDNFGSGYAPLNPPELPDIGLHGQGLPPQREDQEQARDGRAAPKMEQNPGGGPNNGG